MDHIDPLEIIRPKALAKRLGVHRMTLWRWVREGHWPRPIRLGPNAVGWRAGVVAAELRRREQPPAAED